MSKIIRIDDLQDGIRGTFLQRLSPEDLKRKLAESYLGVLTNDDTLANPFGNLSPAAQDRVPEYLTWIMSQPEYFYFLIKVIFQMKTYPLQCLMLKELYTHKFPILLGSRGLSKSYSLAMYFLIKMLLTPGIRCVITGAGFRQAKIVFEYMEQIWKKSKMLQSCFPGKRDGPNHGTDVWTFRLGDSTTYALPVGPDGSKIRGFRANCVGRNTLIQTDIGLVKISEYLNHNCYKVLNIDKLLEMPKNIYKTEPTDVYEIVTQNGYTIKCSKVHRLLTTNGKQTSWKYAKDLTQEDYLELDNNDYFPDRYIEINNVKVDENLGYLLGLLVSEGTVTNRNYIEITHTNKDLIDEIKNRFNNYNWKEISSDAKIDSRGWKCKKRYDIKYCNTEFRETLQKLGLNYNSALHKEIPWCILQSPKSVIIEFLKGLFIGDGSCFRYSSKGKLNIGVSYYTSSINLVEQLQVLLLKFNIVCAKTPRYTKISGNKNYMLAMRGAQAFKIFDIVKNQYWDEHIIKCGHKFERSMKFRKNGDKYIVATTRCNKNIYIGSFSTLEESEKAFKEYWDNTRPALLVKSVTLLKEKEVLFDFTMPKTESFLGGGFVNHNCLVAEEFSSVNRAVFEEVMSGFLSVAASPIEQIEHNACMSTMKKLMIPISSETEDNSNIIQNQLILSGTAYYKFNHFYQYFHKWREILYTRGDKKKLREILGADQDVENFNWRDYSIIRIPVELVPTGFMDMDQINRTKASSSADVYKREFGCTFSDDSDGFFKRSLINSCTVNEFIPIIKGREEIKFNPALYGDKTKKYIYGIDPAYQGDNFAIVILEIHETHRRIVHSWTTQASDHKERLKAGVVTENDYYHYCVKKIRSLMKRFPCAYIALDSDGGGKAIVEAFMDTSKLEPGEEMILPVINPEEKPKDTDFMQGDHILHIIKFTSEWITEANHALKKDMEVKDLIFPYHDSISYVEAEFYDESIVGDSKELYDTLDDCIYDIEELKNELSTITISETATGKERFDTPDIKTGIAKKGRLRKDRYSALLLANWIARTHSVFITRMTPQEVMTMGAAHNIDPSKCFLGNNKLANALNDLYS